MLPSEILSKAADLVEREGWTQGAFGRNSAGREVKRVAKASCFCLVGAIRAAAGEKAFDALVGGGEALQYAWDTVDAPPAAWNDAPERTQSEVVSALRRAADLARAEGR